MKKIPINRQVQFRVRVSPVHSAIAFMTTVEPVIAQTHTLTAFPHNRDDGHAGSIVVVGSPLTDAEDDVLGRLHRRNTDDADQASIVEVVLAHGVAVAFHEVRVLRRAALHGAVAPLA
jgi:hypothetical protein